jgi:hypothetical protein
LKKVPEFHFREIRLPLPMTSTVISTPGFGTIGLGPMIWSPGRTFLKK